ncbi:PDR/VanB family oxidoreductase [Variovorax sp. IB41]|uniref:PDR/VanB family oxidoreductase n=1 Tax=Variovorax sp. IB41 TaxID=2779370 RepID=UPI0018E74144|nr:PDR/VanB family oxidoreductase [Variovorax sp. IB41]MBJ2154762.1 oxidoreductase [Variovorax sp. IB41]
MTQGADILALVVASVTPLTPAIKAFVLRPANGGELPPFAPGAHLSVSVQVAQSSGQRAYSLVRPHDGSSSYEIAVLHEPEGSGGSAWMHGLVPGAVLAAHPPRNDFALHEGALPPLLVAGGIGITPLLCMARALAAEGQAFDFFYATRSEEATAYLADVRALGGTVVHDGGDPARGLDLRALLAAPQSGRHLHVCGPRGMVQAVVDTARAQGWPENHVHFELFAGALAEAGDTAFEVRTLRSGKTLAVAPGQSLLDVLIAAGLDPMYDCRQGDCGVCVVDVVEGVPDHRDHNLSPREKAGGKTLCTCVSRAKTPHLVLDI